MLTLTEFLLERIAEDESTIPCEWNCHERAYAECAAKRRIVEDATNQHTSGPELDQVVRVLAAVYDDHLDYDEGWKP